MPGCVVFGKSPGSIETPWYGGFVQLEAHLPPVGEKIRSYGLNKIISLDNTILCRYYSMYDHWIQIKRDRKDLEWKYIIETPNRYSKSSQEKIENVEQCTRSERFKDSPK